MPPEMRSQKTCIFGIQGSGKTTFAKKIYRRYFKKPIVFMVNDDDGWQKLPGLYVYKADRLRPIEEFALFIENAHSWAQAGKIDAILIDEADMFFRTNWDLSPKFQDIVLNHRHFNDGKGVAVWLMTRRPQDIPTKIVETSRFLVIFKLEGANAIQRFKEIHSALPEKIQELDYEKHDYILKEIGKEPQLCVPLK